VIACYAPESYSLSDFKKKIKGDYDSYHKNWENTHTEWRVIFNGAFLSNMIQYVEMLKINTQKIGIDHILDLIEQQNWTKKNKIFEYLGIGPEYIKADIIEEAIEDIIKHSENTVSLKIENPILPTTKIELNYSVDEIEDAENDLESFYQNASYISNVLADFNEQYPILLDKVKTDFSKYEKSLSFKVRFELIVKDYAEKAKKQDDDFYVYYVKMLMLYCFEQCVIGKKK
jgi:hypothetical protein